MKVFFRSTTVGIFEYFYILASQMLRILREHIGRLSISKFQQYFIKRSKYVRVSIEISLYTARESYAYLHCTLPIILYLFVFYIVYEVRAYVLVFNRSGIRNIFMTY